MPTDRQREAAAKNSKRGYRFQYRVACAMTEVWGLKVVSSPRSGGSHWKGDVIPKDPATDWNSWPFVVECKSRGSWDFRQLLMNLKGGVIVEWWLKVCREAAMASYKFPLLVLTCRSRPGDFIVTACPMWNWCTDLSPVITWNGEDEAFFIHEFKQFLKHRTLEEWVQTWVSHSKH